MPPALQGIALFSLLLPLVAGGAAVFLLLPRPQPYASRWGTALAALALVLTGIYIIRTTAPDPETFLFYLFSCTAVVSGGLLVTQHQPARAALSFTLVILSVSGLFLLLAAPFLAVATVIIYAGAIIVTFLFVIMLAQQAGMDPADLRSREPLLSVLTGFVLLGTLVYILQISYEQSDFVRVIDDVLSRTHNAQLAGGTDLARFREEELNVPFRTALDIQEQKHANTTELKALCNQIQTLTLDWPGKKGPENSLAEVESALLQARQRHGFLHANGNPIQTPLSDQSGPTANEPADQIRYGADGRPQMPHENSAYLGRSLFTDYLLPVELGGVLLLVATVGAIAIAHRVQPERQP